MSELNKKNINYGALNRFYQDLKSHDLSDLNDKIDNINVKPIDNVETLPDAEENKDSVLRLEGDEQVYISKYGEMEVPITPTNRLPDAQQIDKAYIHKLIPDANFHYKGIYRIVCTDGEFSGYAWYYFDGEFWYMTITEDNAENISGNTLVYASYLNNEETSGVLDMVNKTITFDDMTIDNVKSWGYASLTIGNYIPVPATYNAPEANQIGNAYLNNGSDSPFIYKGELEVECTNGNAIFYYWDAYDEWDSTYLTKIPASDIVSDTTGEYCATKFNFFTNMSIDSVTLQYNGTVDDCYSRFDSRSFTIGYIVEDGGGLYIPQLNAPDSEQVNNAYYYNVNSSANTFYYTGEDWTIKITSDGGPTGTVIEEQSGFKLWNMRGNTEGEFAYLTVESANEVYSNNCKTLWLDEPPMKDFETHICYLYVGDTPSIDDALNELFVTRNNFSFSTVKYQRTTEHGFGYQWKKVVTEDEIVPELGIDESTFTGTTLTVDGSQPSIVASGTTTIVWDDLASSIPSGKTVEVSVVLINTGNSALTPTMSGNVQMMGAGNITIQPLELGLYKAKYISAVDVWLVEAVNQEVSGVME